eukprot:11162447-Lingulodinium_polyedra.AAC.1
MDNTTTCWIYAAGGRMAARAARPDCVLDTFANYPGTPANPNLRAALSCNRSPPAHAQTGATDCLRAACAITGQ